MYSVIVLIESDKWYESVEKMAHAHIGASRFEEEVLFTKVTRFLNQQLGVNKVNYIGNKNECIKR